MKATGQAMHNARAQRRSPSLPEAMLWRLLRGSPGGVRFRHQHAVGPYVADFYCATAKLVIELDGAVHDNEAARDQDQRRDDFLREEGLSVLRILAADVLRDPVAVADGLVRLCTSRDGPSTTQLR